MPKATNNGAVVNEAGEAVAGGNELEMNRPHYENADLRAIGSFDEALALLAEQGIEVEDVADAIGDGFALLDSERKSRLEGVPLLFMTWSFAKSDSDKGDGEYVVARIIAKEQSGVAKYVITDGSTGIYADLLRYTKEKGGKIGGLIAHKGLRASHYQVEVDGKMQDATTYYIDTSK